MLLEVDGFRVEEPLPLPLSDEESSGTRAAGEVLSLHPPSTEALRRAVALAAPPEYLHCYPCKAEMGSALYSSCSVRLGLTTRAEARAGSGATRS